MSRSSSCCGAISARSGGWRGDRCRRLDQCRDAVRFGIRRGWAKPDPKLGVLIAITIAAALVAGIAARLAAPSMLAATAGFAPRTPARRGGGREPARGGALCRAGCGGAESVQATQVAAVACPRMDIPVTSWAFWSPSRRHSILYFCQACLSAAARGDGPYALKFSGFLALPMAMAATMSGVVLCGAFQSLLTFKTNFSSNRSEWHIPGSWSARASQRRTDVT